MRIRIAVLSTLLAAAAAGHAQVTPQPVSLPDLESAYWHCIALDARSTADGQRMDESMLTDCTDISKRLQIARFGDDFGRLHEWTNAQKSLQGSPNVPVGSSRYTE
jgi:hypothetical protein